MSKVATVLFLSFLSFLSYAGIPAMPEVIENFNFSYEAEGEPTCAESEGNPISRRLGNKFQKETDYEGVLLNALSFNRYYNSRVKQEGTLWKRSLNSRVGYVFTPKNSELPPGQGYDDQKIKDVPIYSGEWSHSYGDRLVLDRGIYFFQLKFIRSDGLVIKGPAISDSNAESTYTVYFGEAGFIYKNSDEWIVQDEDGRKKFYFDDNGKLKRIKFLNNQEHIITYGEQEITVVDDYGNQLKIRKDESGKIQEVITPNNQKISYQWNGDLLTKATYPGYNSSEKSRHYHYLPYDVFDSPQYEFSDHLSIEQATFGWAHYTALIGITDEEDNQYVQWGYNFGYEDGLHRNFMARAETSENVGFNKTIISTESLSSRDITKVEVTKGDVKRVYDYSADYINRAFIAESNGDIEDAGCEVGGNVKTEYLHTLYEDTLSHCKDKNGWDCVDGVVFRKVTNLDTELVTLYQSNSFVAKWPGSMSDPSISLSGYYKDRNVLYISHLIPKIEADKWGDTEECGPEYCHYRLTRIYRDVKRFISGSLSEGQQRNIYSYGKLDPIESITDVDFYWSTDPDAHYKSYKYERKWLYTYTNSTDEVPGLIKTIDGPRHNDTIIYTYYPKDDDFPGFVHTIKDPEGLVTTFEEYTPDGRPLKIKLPTGLVLTLTYHPRGWLTSIDEGGALTQYSYYENGLLKRITDPEGNWIEYTYNAGRILTKIAANNGDEVNFTAFDHYGQWEELNIKDGPDGTIRYQQNRAFDAVGRLEELTGQNGQNLTSPFDGQDNIKYFRQKYEQQDGTIATRDTNLERDILGRIRKVTYPDGGVILLDYDKRDNLTKVTDQNNLVTTYTYDGFDNLARVDSPDTGTTKYWYDLAGNVTKVEDQNGITVTYQYDANNRLQYVTYPASSEENITFIYDETSDGKQGIGELTTITFEHGTIEYFYNSRSEIIKELRTVEGELYETLYDRNLNGEITKITYPSGREVQYHYTDGLITKVSTRENDTASWLVVAENLSYKPFGPLKGLDLGNGLTLTKDYDLDYRITENILKQSDTESLKDKAYSYYITDNISAILENTGNIDSQLFAYDAVDRLTSATGEYGNYAYGYDGVGNRTSINRNSTAHSYEYYSGTHRLKQIKQGETVIRSFQYDAAGNLIEDNRGSDVFKLAYNSEGRPKQLERYQNGTLTNSTLYKYNPLGQRIMMVTDGANHYLNYGLDGRMMAEYTDNNTLKAEYIYLHGDLLAVVQPEQVAWAGVNESGGQLSPIAESNNTLTIAASTGTRFYSHTLEGDGEIQTKVGNIGHAKDLSKAGLMIKESQAADAPYVKLVRTSESSFVPIAGEIFIPLIFGKDGMMLEYTDSSTNQVVQKTFSDQGDWLKLVRTGNYIEAQVSTDGVTWTTVESVFQPMKSNVQLGVITQNIQATDELVLEQVQTQGTLYTAQASAIYYAYNNHLGAPLLLTDQAGNTVWEVTYSPFGETTTQVDSIDQPIRLPGQYAYDATGYYYNYFRDYDPSLGRYVQSDPIGLSGGISTYGYVGGNPLMYIDPEGLDLKKKVRDVIFVLGLGLSDGDVSPDAGRRTHDHRDNKGRTEQLQFEKRKKRPFDPDKKDKDKGNGDLPSFSPWDFPVWNACQAGEAPCSVCEAFGYSSPSCNDVPEEC